MADMRNWSHLGIVDTIYEEEDCDFYSSSCPSLSPSSLPSPHTPLHSRVDAWSLATGRETDVLIRVQGTCFRLHKERLTSRSSYLKRRLTDVSEFTLSPPLNITADTFSFIADFCYGRNVQITPSNVAALRTATELLGMTESKGFELEQQENLRAVTEEYFREVIAVSQEYASLILRSCLPLLPEAETTSFLVSRCIEAMGVGDEEEGHFMDDVVSGLEDVAAMRPQDFLVVAESMNRRLRNHDVLYKIVDLYLKENNLIGKLSEEERSHISNCIDCTKLSPETLIECVQNPRMPLRFIIKAMLVEQLNTRNSIVSAATATASHNQNQIHRRQRRRSEVIAGADDRNSNYSTTLGDFLRRDAALRHSAQLRVAMDSTSSRIQSLEKELRGMKKLLLESSTRAEPAVPVRKALLDGERPASFHYAPASASGDNRMIERGERGSVSSLNYRFDSDVENSQVDTPKVAKSFRQRLISGFKSAFRVSNSAAI